MVLHFHSVGLLIIVFLAIVQSQPQVVFISPDPKDLPCPNKSAPCMTLSQYASQSSDQFASETTLRFLPGKHLLTRVLTATNLSSFAMLSNNSKAVVKISCLLHGHFEFSNFQSVHMSDLQLEGCHGNTIDAVTKFVLTNSLISGSKNHSEYALSIVDSDMTISDCNFTYNKGGALLMNNSIVHINMCNFTNNRRFNYNFFCGGGLCVDTNNNVSITNSIFDNNSAGLGSSVYVYTNNNVSITNSTFDNNSAGLGGGGVYVHTNNNISITNSMFDNNSAGTWGGGGGIYVVSNNTVSITNSTFDNNSADVGGGGGGVYVATNNTVSIANSTFNNNSGGGGVYVDTNNHVSIAKSTFDKNSAEHNGGGVHVGTNNNVSITNSTFDNNIAGTEKKRGAIFAGGIYVGTNNNVSITNSTFDRNSAASWLDHAAIFAGGGIYMGTNNSVSITNSTFSDHNIAASNQVFSFTGGGVYVNTNNNVSITNCTFDNNNGGGSVYVGTNNNVSITNSTFDNNSANNGACVYVVDHSTVEFRGNTNMRRNKGNSIVHMVKSSVYFSGHTTIEHNNGSIFVLSSNISFHGSTKLLNNSQPRNFIQRGGLITTLRSNVSFTNKVEILNNTADNGAISVVQSNVYIYGNVLIEHNNARLSGGGIYAYLSQVDFNVNCTIRGNTAVRSGGGIHAVGSTVSLSKGSLLITENTADLGGGMCLELNAKLMIFTESSENRNYLNFTYNVAHIKGGAIYVADNTLSGTCAGNDSSSTISECFFQALALYSDYSFNSYKDTVFFNNTANEGETLYGGLLDRCSISPLVEGYEKGDYVDATGSDYFRDVIVIEDKNNNSITSDPVRICLCSDNKPNCSNPSPKIQVKKGHTIDLSVVAVDQVGRQVSVDNGLIIHAFLLKAHQGSGFKEGQTSQQYIDGSCTQLQYNIISQQPSEELVLYAEGPCKDVGISKLVIPIKFLECTCLDGFKPSTSIDNCSCECDPKLFKPQPYIENCSSADSTLLRSGTSWISYIHNCTDSFNSKQYSNSFSSAGYVVSLYCPYDYCKPADQHVYIDISMPNGSDAQCAFNRSGKLCGSCEGSLSHSLGSSQCMSCTNTWLALLLPFSLAGIALVIFILMLNLTVALGTINGIIFYANIIAANRATFLPFDKPNILTIFIAWLNLDLGIETCFYNGMDAYGKIWLQFMFPAYIIILVFVIIVICRWSERFANLIGSKNPVATLATLFLLSYTKLLRLTITALTSTYLDHLSDGSKELVWLYDANVAYLKGKHIPLFVAAILIIVFGVIYTFLLLFWQWLQHCSNWRFLRWMNNTKLKALMDAYHAPYQPKHRYWTGLLLLARVVLYLVSALNFSSDPSINLFTVSCVLSILLSLKIVCTQSKIYKNWGLDTLDTLCLLNLLLLAAASFYLLYLCATMNIDILKGRRLQLSIAYTSASISFALFLTILVYHLYNAFLKMTFCKILHEKLHISRNNKQQKAYEEIRLLSDTSSDESSDEEDSADLRRELRDIVTGPPNTNEYCQLEAATRRARAMERRRKKANKQEVTHTVVEIPWPEPPLSVQIKDSPNTDCPPPQQIRDSPNIDCPPTPAITTDQRLP